MKRVILLVVCVLLATPVVAIADDVTVADLQTDSASFDAGLVGEITVEGELVGDFQRRGDWVWVQINGDPYVTAPLRAGGGFAGANVGVGARIPAEEFDALGVSTPGGYRVRGPIVRLTGEWRHHDESRGGESYLDTRRAAVIQTEMVLSEGVRWWSLVLGAVLVVAASAAWFVVRRRGPIGE